MGYRMNPFSGVLDMVSGNCQYAVGTASTTDATKTSIASLNMEEGVVMFVEAMVSGTKSDQSSVGGAFITGLFKRATGGNVTQVGDTEMRAAQLSGTWNVEFTADTSNQQIDIDVTGATATAISWKADVKYLVIG